MEKKEIFEIRLKSAEKLVNDLLKDDILLSPSPVGGFLQIASFALYLAVFCFSGSLQLNSPESCKE